MAQSQQGIFVSQQKHVMDLLKETGKSTYKPIDTPMEPNHKLGDNSNDSVDKGNNQRLMG